MAHQQSRKKAAKDLLQSIISEEQWNRFNQSGTIELAAKGGIYRVSMHGPTQLLDSESRRVVATTCLDSTPHVSSRDRAIAEYLFIRNDENLYWQTAKISAETPNQRPLVLLMAAFNAMLLIVLLAQLHW